MKEALLTETPRVGHVYAKHYCVTTTGAKDCRFRKIKQPLMSGTKRLWKKGDENGN